MKNLYRKLHKKLLLAFDSFIPSESIVDSKSKWNSLAEENARYYVLSDQGKEISEAAFREAGKKDYEGLVLADNVVREKINPQSKVLEIGCGIGRITEFFARDVGGVYGIDISRKMIDGAQKRLSEYKNIHLFETNGVEYPFESEFFDLAFSFIVFQHMPDKKVIEKNMLEVGRVLKRGGVAKIQFRGAPVVKGQWFYGPALALNDIEAMGRRAGLKIISQDGAGERYFWVHFCK